VKHRFRNSVKDVQTLPGADIDSDHNLLVVKVRITLKKIIRFQKSRPRWDLEKLYTQRQRVQNTLEEKLSAMLFADDTSVLITGQTAHKFQDDLNSTFSQISEWFKQNSLSLNISKTYFIQFSSKSLNYLEINITYKNKYITKVNDLKFLGLNINNTLSWKTHIDKILPKLSSACFAMRSVKPFVSQQMLKVIYYSHFHSIILYGIIFWGNSAPSSRVFRMQKRIIRIMMGSRSRDSCRKLFTSLKILPFPSVYIFFSFSSLS